MIRSPRLVLTSAGALSRAGAWIVRGRETVPPTSDKSALVDGCNRLQAYWRVVLPVSGPGLVAGGAFTFMLCWNEFVVAQVLNTKPGTTTLPPVIELRDEQRRQARWRCYVDYW